MRATDKPFNITKKQVYEAYKAVKSNHGAAGSLLRQLVPVLFRGELRYQPFAGVNSQPRVIDVFGGSLVSDINDLVCSIFDLLLARVQLPKFLVFSEPPINRSLTGMAALWQIERRDLPCAINKQMWSAISAV